AARWPGRIKAGSGTERIALTMDLFPTVLEAAGIAAPAGVDGVSFLPTLRGDAQAEPKRDLYFVRREGGLMYGGKTIEAFRQGDWKLVQDSPFAPIELYNLRDDPQESTNVASKEKKVFQTLSAALR